MAERRKRAWFRTTRRVLRLTERTLGDADAAHRGVLPKRLVRRWATRRAGRVWDRLWR